MSRRLHSALYFLVQRLRGGVTQAMVADARRLLDQPWPRIRNHISERLASVHNVEEDGLDWLARQPIHSKEFYRNRFAKVDTPDLGRGYERRHTSGSTGTPLHLVKDRDMLASMDAAMWSVYSWHGVHPGDRQARFWGTPLDWTSRLRRSIVDLIIGQRRLGAFDIRPESSLRYFRLLRRWKPDYAYGYPTLMRQFIEHCRGAGFHGGELDLKVVISTGELLSPQTRTTLADFFDTPVVNEYGCTESGILAFECESGVSHLIPIAAYSEVLDADEVEGSASGRVVVSDLYGSYIPLVRYDLGDRGLKRADSSCECGRELPELEISTGRSDSFIQTADRGKVYDAILAYSVPESVSRFRAYQRELDHLEVKIVPIADAGDPEVIAEQCRTAWKTVLGDNMRITVQVVDDLPHMDSGKLRYFVPMEQ